jgi:2,3-bisphosphoglycerate-independent phosphoglycerate mutase
LHFIGLLSDGNVHSHIDHLFALLDRAVKEGVRRVRVHTLLDGRDVPATSALIYVERLEEKLESIRGDLLDYRIASGGGRMITTMDRYEADWNIVKRGWDAHVHGKGRGFPDALSAIETYRREEPGLSDQFIPPFVVTENGVPVGVVRDGDSVVFFNFRGDRAIEISRAFDEEEFDEFDRLTAPDVLFTGMMEYDGDRHIPKHFLVCPPAIDRTISAYLVSAGIEQIAVAETQKFGHVTYFWNGNRSGKLSANLETYVEIRSDQVPFEQRPWMKAAEVTDQVLAALEANRYRFIRVNYANGDMVGHTGKMDAAILAVEAVDLCLARLWSKIRRAQGVLVITADHGNADQMYQLSKNGEISVGEHGEPLPLTSHTLNPVMFLIADEREDTGYIIDPPSAPGLSNVAATVLNLLGYEKPEEYDQSLIQAKG